MTVKPTYKYVTYIESTPEAVWRALTDADITASYWGHQNVSDWNVGSQWEHRRVDGSGIADVVGSVIESEAPHRLVTSWASPDNLSADATSQVTYTIEPYGSIVRLTVVHENLADEEAHNSISFGWPAILSNLKSLLETGHVLPDTPWEMPTN